MARDDFPQSVVEEVAGRAGYHCSWPGCPNATIGPRIGKPGVTITGKAGHICAASEKGPRYDRNMTKAQRRSIDNAIWMCGQHHDIIDRNSCPNPAKLLRYWKVVAEARAAQEQASPKGALTDQAALIMELPGVKNVYQLHTIVGSLPYTRDAACPIESTLKGSGAYHVLGLAAELACEVWDDHPDLSGLLLTMLTTNPDQWTWDTTIAGKMQQLGSRSLGEQDYRKVGSIEPVAYTLAAKGEEALFRQYLNMLAEDVALQSADVLRVQTYYMSDFARLDAFMRHARDGSKRGVCRANDVTRLMDLLIKADRKNVAYRKELLRLMNEGLVPLRGCGEAALAAKIETEIAPFKSDLI